MRQTRGFRATSASANGRLKRSSLNDAYPSPNHSGLATRGASESTAADGRSAVGSGNHRHTPQVGHSAPDPPCLARTRSAKASPSNHESLDNSGISCTTPVSADRGLVTGMVVRANVEMIWRAMSRRTQSALNCQLGIQNELDGNLVACRTSPAICGTCGTPQPWHQPSTPYIGSRPHDDSGHGQPLVNREVRPT